MKQKPLISYFLILLTFLSGVAYAFYLGNNKFLFHDETQYLKIAQNIAAEHLFSLDGSTPTAWRPPGYPSFLAPFVSLFGANIILLRCINYLLLSSSMLLVYEMLKPSSRTAALIGVALMLWYPVFFYAAGTLYPQTFAMFLFLLALYIFFKDPQLTMTRAASVGLLLGILILTIPTFVMMFVLFLYWTARTKKKNHWRYCFTIFTVALIVLTPWTIRNYRTFDSFVFVSTNGGVNFLIGNSKNTHWNSGVNTDITDYLKEDLNTEVEADRHFKTQALNYIWNNKLKTLKNYFQKFLNYFNFSNDLATNAEKATWRDYTLLITYGSLFVLTILRLCTAHRASLKDFERFMILAYILNGAFTAIFFTRIRFRIPFDPILVMLSSQYLAYQFCPVKTSPMQDKNG